MSKSALKDAHSIAVDKRNWRGDNLRPLGKDTVAMLSEIQSRTAEAKAASESGDRRAQEFALLCGLKAALAARSLDHICILLASMADCLEQMGDRGGAVSAWNVAYEYAKAGGDDEGRISILLKMGRICYESGEYNGSRRYYEGALKLQIRQGVLSEQTETVERLVAAHVASLSPSSQTGGVEHSRVALPLEVVQPYSDLIDRAVYEHDYAVAVAAAALARALCSDRRRYDAAMSFIARELEAAGRLPVRSLVARAHTAKGSIHLKLGDYRLALLHHGIAYKIVDELNDLQRMAAAAGELGTTSMLLGSYGDAQKYLQQQLTIGEQISCTENQSGALSGLAQVCVRMGDSDRALEYGERAVEVAQTTGQPRLVALALLAVGAARYALTDYAAAETALLDAVDLASECGDAILEARVYQSLARVRRFTERGLTAVCLRSTLKCVTELQPLFDSEDHWMMECGQLWRDAMRGLVRELVEESESFVDALILSEQSRCFSWGLDANPIADYSSSMSFVAAAAELQTTFVIYAAGGPDSLYAWVVNKAECRPFVLEIDDNVEFATDVAAVSAVALGMQGLEELGRVYETEWATHEGVSQLVREVGDPTYAGQALERLYSCLIAPIEHVLAVFGNTSNASLAALSQRTETPLLTFVPDPVLAGIPFAALLNPESKQRLIETYAVCSSHALTQVVTLVKNSRHRVSTSRIFSLKTNSERQTEASSILVLRGDSPAERAQAEALESMFVDVTVEPTANHAAVINCLSRPSLSLVHLSSEPQDEGRDRRAEYVSAAVPLIDGTVLTGQSIAETAVAEVLVLDCVTPHVITDDGILGLVMGAVANDSVRCVIPCMSAVKTQGTSDFFKVFYSTLSGYGANRDGRPAYAVRAAVLGLIDKGDVGVLGAAPDWTGWSVVMGCGGVPVRPLIPVVKGFGSKRWREGGATGGGAKIGSGRRRWLSLESMLCGPAEGVVDSDWLGSYSASLKETYFDRVVGRTDSRFEPHSGHAFVMITATSHLSSHPHFSSEMIEELMEAVEKYNKRTLPVLLLALERSTARLLAMQEPVSTRRSYRSGMPQTKSAVPLYSGRDSRSGSDIRADLGLGASTNVGTGATATNKEKAALYMAYSEHALKRGEERAVDEGLESPRSPANAVDDSSFGKGKVLGKQEVATAVVAVSPFGVGRTTNRLGPLSVVGTSAGDGSSGDKAANNTKAPTTAALHSVAERFQPSSRKGGGKKGGGRSSGDRGGGGGGSRSSRKGGGRDGLSNSGRSSGGAVGGTLRSGGGSGGGRAANLPPLRSNTSMASLWGAAPPRKTGLTVVQNAPPVMEGGGYAAPPHYKWVQRSSRRSSSVRNSSQLFHRGRSSTSLGLQTPSGGGGRSGGGGGYSGGVSGRSGGGGGNSGVGSGMGGQASRSHGRNGLAQSLPPLSTTAQKARLGLPLNVSVPLRSRSPLNAHAAAAAAHGVRKGAPSPQRRLAPLYSDGPALWSEGVLWVRG